MFGRDLLAAAVDQLFDTALNRQVSVHVDEAEIPAPHPPVNERLRGRLRVLEVAAYDISPAQPDFACRSGGRRPSSVVDDANHLIGVVTVDDVLDHLLPEDWRERDSEGLTQIDVALARIEDGSYGTCTGCGKSIPEERLEARPWATLCIDCQRNADRR